MKGWTPRKAWVLLLWTLPLVVIFWPLGLVALVGAVAGVIASYVNREPQARPFVRFPDATPHEPLPLQPRPGEYLAGSSYPRVVREQPTPYPLPPPYPAKLVYPQRKPLGTVGFDQFINHIEGK